MKQVNLFETNTTEDADKNWFQAALDFLGVNEKAGWPDVFGNNFNAWINTQDRKKIKTLSLFSGGGGLDIAFHDMGFDIYECVEIEKRFADTLRINSAPGKRLFGCNVVCKDIREYDTDDDIDFIIGGPPCQTFSAAGARASGVNGIDDDRGVLFQEYVRLLNKTKPKAFLFENVYRIIGAQGGKPWTLIQEAFKNAGYRLFWRILDTADYGVPQHRERVIIVGVKNSIDFLFPVPTHGPDSSGQKEYYSAGNAVEDIDSSGYSIGINGRHGHLLNDIPPGLNYSFYTEKMGHPRPIFGWRSKFSDYLYKADPNVPVRTIKAQGGQYTGPFSWENRPFMIEELKRLQTFPDDYEISGNRQIAIHQIGNSVPPQIGRILALAILDQIFMVKLPFTIEYLSHDQKLGFRARKSSLTEVYKSKASKSIDSKYTNEKYAFYESQSGCCDLYLTDSFQLVKDNQINAIKYRFKYSINNEIWEIECNKEGSNDKSKKYCISIKLSASQKKVTQTTELHLISKDESAASVLALWKFLELKLRELVHKDDLIQLFGYYQYKQASHFKFKQFKKELHDQSFWSVVEFITKGIGVGKTLGVNELSDCYGVNKDQLLNVLKNLKDIGFEIRSNNTNNQIPVDNYLIPYQYPTLNERSLQRLTYL